MKLDSLAALTVLLQEPSLSAANTKLQRQKTEIIKLSEVIKLHLSMPPPDEKKVEELNTLAAKHPFCRIYKAKKHETL